MAGTLATKTTRRTISPYDLSTNDNPGAVISQPLLNGRNYDEWAQNLRVSLSARKKFAFIDGTIPKPPIDSTDYEDWMANNHLLVTWIKLTIESKLRSNISHKEEAKDLWDHIKRRFALKSGARYQQLRASLANCRQSGSSVEDYFGRLTKIWDSMAECLTVSSCKCGKCDCNLMEAQEKERDIIRVHDFLFGLDDATHGPVRSQICAQIPIPDLDTVYQTIVQNETVQNNSHKEPPAVLSFAAQTPANSTSSSNSRQSNQSYDGSRQGNSNNNGSRPPRYVNPDANTTCTACGRLGHRATGCFRVIGYPEWWGTRPRNRNNVQGGQTTTSSTESTNPTQANSSQISTSPTHIKVNSALTEIDRQGLAGITDAQWHTLVTLINSQKTRSDTRLSGKIDEPLWILDTGATHHMTGRLDLLKNIRPVAPVPVTLPAGANVLSNQQGTIQLTSHIHLKNVYYVDGFHTNLISFGQLLTDQSLVGQVTDRLVILQDRTTRTLIGAGERESEGLYHFRGIETVTAFQTTTTDEGVLWHRRLGHPSSRVVDLLPDIRLKPSSKLSLSNCDVCFRSKQTRNPFPESNNKASTSFELIHCDLWGPYRTAAFCGSRYFLTIVDDYSRALWLYLLPDKTEVSARLQEFIALVKRQFNCNIKTIRSDNGTEFMCLTKYFRKEGIIHETSCVGTPQQNGRVERKHRHILNVARALRFQAGLPIEFWAECALTACYLINRTPTKILNDKTPFELLFGRAPVLDQIRVFGCLCYAHNLNHHGDKFTSRSRRCVFLGYPYGKKGWRLYDIEKEEIFNSRDVMFQEDTFPYLQTKTDLEPKTVAVTSNPTLLDDDEHEPIIPTNQTTTTETTDPAPTPQNSEQLGRGCRIKKTSTKLADYVTDTPASANTVSPRTVSINTVTINTLTTTAPTATSGTDHPLSNYHIYDRFSPSHRSYLVALSIATEPRSYREAMQDKLWKEAMRLEISALELNDTWEIQELPPGKIALGCKWVFRIKLKADGTLERYKARLVVLGNNQIEGIDYGETFAPVAKMTTVRIFLDIAAKQNYEVHQMDVHNAFLHGDLDEEVYIKLPPGFRSDSEKRVCRLRKSLYGLKQAPRCWFAKLTNALRAFGFLQSRSDYSLFVYNKNGNTLRVLVYVDDLIIAGNSSSSIEDFKTYLSTCFHMKDLGILKYFLGIEVARSPDGFYLCQRKYCLDIITEVGMLGCKPAGFPLDQRHQLDNETGLLLPDPGRYRRLVGRLVYLASTRPDLAFSIHVLTQYMQTPRTEHWEAAIHVIRYLKGSIGQGIMLRAASPIHVTGWSDSDWAGCSASRRSVTGWIAQIGTSIVSWKSQKQDTVSLSSTEAEYRAMTEILKELLWIKGLLLDFGINHTEPMTLRCDNQSAIYLSSNPVFHERTKHVEAECHFIRDFIIKGTISTKHVSSKEQLADILTKALGRKEFDIFLYKLGIRDLYAPT